MRRRFLTHTDPIGERLHALATRHEKAILAARTAAARSLRLPLDAVGVLLVGRVSGVPGQAAGTARGMATSELLAMAQRSGLDTTPGDPGFWPVLVLDAGPRPGTVDGAICWLTEALNPTARGLA
jgi:hypothetical protein